VHALGTLEDDRTVLYRTKSLDGTKPNTNPEANPKTSPNPNTNPTQLFCPFYEHRLQTSHSVKSTAQRPMDSLDFAVRAKNLSRTCE